MKKILPHLAFALTLLIFANCGQRQPTSEETTLPETENLESEVHQAFFDNLRTLCGQSFKGEQVYRSHHGESWAGREMIMHVSVCENNQIHIPFHVDDDHSRTWMFLNEEGKLRFRHQHLHDDGTHEEGSMYGGYANDQGNAFVQYFPADEYTAQVIEDGGGNVWTVSLLNPNPPYDVMTVFSYRLDRDGEKRFEIVFDITNPI